MLHPAEIHPNSHTEEIINLTHLLTVSLSQVIVDRYDVNALTEERIQINRQGTNQCLPFTGFHLGNAAFMESHPPD
ncbi:hypothetical protein D3C77_433510 [compost metagenome]